MKVVSRFETNRVRDRRARWPASIASAAFVLVVGVLAGCATIHSQMMTLAEKLQRSADTFAGETSSNPPAGTVWDAREFADEARSFRQTVVALSGDRNVTLAFERLWRSYHSLRDEVERSNNRQAELGLQPVTQAFIRVERGMSAYADSALYARGGYRYDPYYND